MKKDRIAAGLLAMSLLAPNIMPATVVNAAQAGWVSTGSTWKYMGSNGSYVKNAWRRIDGKWYWFEADGTMKTGWHWEGDNRYFLTSSGAMATGWYRIDGKWHFFGENGVQRSGWVKDQGKWYYIDSWDGMYSSQWLEEGNHTYYFRSNGAMVENDWALVDGEWYFFNESGKMQTGWISWKGEDYYLHCNGKMAKDEYILSGDGTKGYYLNADGIWDSFKDLIGYQPDQNAWKQLYKDYVNNVILKDPDYPHTGISYSLLDINLDGTPELLVDYNYTAGGFRLATVYNGALNVKSLMWGRICNLADENMFLHTGGRTGAYFDQIYEVRNGRIICVQNGSWTDGVAENGGQYKPSYFWNGTSVSETEYLSLVKSYVNSDVDKLDSGKTYDTANALFKAIDRY